MAQGGAAAADQRRRILEVRSLARRVPAALARAGDPYTLLARLRDYDPVNETPFGIWRLTRYDDVVRMLREVPSGVRFADGSVFGGQAPASAARPLHPPAGSAEPHAAAQAR